MFSEIYSTIEKACVGVYDSVVESPPGTPIVSAGAIVVGATVVAPALFTAIGAVAAMKIVCDIATKISEEEKAKEAENTTVTT